MFFYAEEEQLDFNQSAYADKCFYLNRKCFNGLFCEIRLMDCRINLIIFWLMKNWTSHCSSSLKHQWVIFKIKSNLIKTCCIIMCLTSSEQIQHILMFISHSSTGCTSCVMYIQVAVPQPLLHMVITVEHG
jgi:hypothetical protein